MHQEVIRYHQQYPSDTYTPAMEAVTDFARLTGNSRDQLHPLRTAGYVYEFCSDLTPLVQTAALLHDVASRYANPAHPDHESSVRSLRKLFYTLQPPERRYVAGLLTDVVELEKHTKSYRSKVESDDPLFVSVVRNGYKGELPTDFWMKDGPVITPEEMKAIVETVNVESFLLGANEILDNLTVPPIRQAAFFQDILEAEYIFAPMLEVMGYSALAAAIRDTASRARLRNAGYGSVVDRAESALEAVSDPFLLDSALRSIIGEHSLVSHTGVSVRRSDAVYRGMGNANVLIGDELLEKQIFRIKSVGSLALKFLSERYNGNESDNFQGVQDILGVNIVVPNWHHAARVMTELMERIVERPDITLTKTPKRVSPLRAQGPQSSIDKLALSLQRSRSRNRIPLLDGVEVDTRKFACFKVTGCYESGGVELPFEIQVTPQAVNDNNRYGFAAHHATKTSSGCILEPEVLESVAARRDKAAEGGARLNAQSEVRARQLVHSFGLEW